MVSMLALASLVLLPTFATGQEVKADANDHVIKNYTQATTVWNLPDGRVASLTISWGNSDSEIHINYIVAQSPFDIIAQGTGYIPRNHVYGSGMRNIVLDTDTMYIDGKVKGHTGAIHVEWTNGSKQLQHTTNTVVTENPDGSKTVSHVNKMYAITEVEGGIIDYVSGSGQGNIGKTKIISHTIEPQN